MVRRKLPLARRLRANIGTIVNVTVWVGAAMTCAVLYAIRAPDPSMRAVALTQRDTVLAPESGRLATLEVHVGDTVTIGQTLGRLEVPGLNHELAAAEAELAAVTAALKEGDPDRARRFIKDTASAEARYLAASVALEGDKAALVGLNLEVGRLSAAGAGVAAAELEAKRAARDTLAADLAAKETEVSALQRTYQEVRALREDGDDPTLEAAVEAAAAAVEQVKARMDQATLRAPADGVVAALSRGSATAAPLEMGTLPSVGMWCPAGTPVLEIVASSSQDAVLYLSPERARELVAGEPVELATALGETFPGKIVAVAPAVEAVPLRLLVDPTVMQWGVPVTVRADSARLLPGEAFDIAF